MALSAANALADAAIRGCLSCEQSLIIWSNAEVDALASEALACVGSNLRTLRMTGVILAASKSMAVRHGTVTLDELFGMIMDGHDHTTKVQQDLEVATCSCQELCDWVQRNEIKRPAWWEPVRIDVIVILDVFNINLPAFRLLDTCFRMFRPAASRIMPFGHLPVVGIGDPYDCGAGSAVTSNYWRTTFLRNYFRWSLPFRQTVPWKVSQRFRRVLTRIDEAETSQAFPLDRFPSGPCHPPTPSSSDGSSTPQFSGPPDELSVGQDRAPNVHSWPVPLALHLQAGDRVLYIPKEWPLAHPVLCLVVAITSSGVQVRRMDHTRELLHINRLRVFTKLLFIGYAAASLPTMKRTALPLQLVRDFPLHIRLDIALSLRPQSIYVDLSDTNSVALDMLLYSMRGTKIVWLPKAYETSKVLSQQAKAAKEVAKSCARLSRQLAVGDKIKLTGRSDKLIVKHAGSGLVPEVTLESPHTGKRLLVIRYLVDYDFA